MPKKLTTIDFRHIWSLRDNW